MLSMSVWVLQEADIKISLEVQDVLGQALWTVEGGEPGVGRESFQNVTQI